jgi:hypothetical protein
MKIAVRLVLLAAALALGWWLWTVFPPSPETAIRKKISALAATVSFDAQASSFVRATKAMSFQGYFNSNVVIVVDVPELGTHTFNGRFELVEPGNAAFAALPGLKVSFLDASVRVNPDQTKAEVSCTVRVYVGKDKDSGVQELRFHFQKINGDWLITRVETVKTLT